MGLFDVIKKAQGDGQGIELYNVEYRKNVFRTDDQRMAAFYFSDENFKIAKGCFKKDEKKKGGGCFEKLPTVETKPYFDDAKGCFKKGTIHSMSDAEYMAIVNKMLAAENFKEKAMEALMLDASEIETDPIRFGYFCDDEDAKWKLGEDLLFRTSCWKETWIFFSKTSLLAYQSVFSLDGNSKSETTYEYQYKDVTSLKIVDATKEKIDRKGQDFKKTCKFEVVVPGDVLSCSFDNDADQINNVKAMKAMIRDKKNN